MDLSTRYMGLALRNPLVASASPLSNTAEGVRRLADAGVGAVVMFSLFEEQLREQAVRNTALVDEPAESFAEALGYFPPIAQADIGPRSYLGLLERAASTVEVPVIGSLNGVTPEGWTGYARSMQDAGAAAIELNVYYLPGDPQVSGREVEQRHIEVLTRVKAAVTVPVAVKLGPYFSSFGDIALRLDDAGADALVLFNRFLQPDIDSEELAVEPMVTLSSPGEARLPRAWIALLRAQVGASLAATGGVAGPEDMAKYLLAGADVVMSTSALLRRGPEYATTLLDGLSAWMARKGFETVDELRGLLACPPRPTGRSMSGPATPALCAPPTRGPTDLGRRGRSACAWSARGQLRMPGSPPVRTLVDTSWRRELTRCQCRGGDMKHRRVPKAQR
jgi:dihydroorotate dehydrogenase (fumarate)